LGLFHINLVDSCFTINQLLRKTNSLTELYLHYNQINSLGGAHLFNALYKNTTLKVLDISYNCLGARSLTDVSDSVVAMSKVISKPHPELVHLDVSHNNFSDQDAKEISKALFSN